MLFRIIAESNMAIVLSENWLDTDSENIIHEEPEVAELRQEGHRSKA
jgi:hypothetical protein